MVVARAAADGVVAVAGADAVVSAAAAEVEMLDAAEVEAVVVAPIVAEIDARVTGLERARQRDAAAANRIVGPDGAADQRPVDGQRVGAITHGDGVATAPDGDRVVAVVCLDLVVVSMHVRIGHDRGPGADNVVAGAGLERQHLDAAHCAGPEIGRLKASQSDVDHDVLARHGEGLVGLPAVAPGARRGIVRAAIDDVDTLAGDQVVVAGAADGGVVAVAGADAVMAAAATDDEVLDAAEVDAVVVA